MATATEVAGIFPAMVERFVPEKAAGVDATILFELSGDNGGSYWIAVADGEAETGAGAAVNAAVTVRCSADDWVAVATGELNAMQAFMTGRLKIQGDMGLAMKLQSMFAQ